MGRARTLTDSEICEIKVLKERGLTNRKIAEKLGRSAKVVNNYINNTKNYGKNRAGRTKRATTERERRAILREASNSCLSAREIKNKVGVSACVRTVQNIINASDHLQRKKIKRKPALKSRHMQDRMDFARKHMTWSNEWESVIFSDEKKLNLDGPDGWAFYYHDLRKEELILSRRQRCQGSVMIWGAISYYGPIDIVILEGRQNAEKYLDLLKMQKIKIGEVMEDRKWIFQHDNASIHTARLVKRWIEEEKIETLQWPALSPDLNIIENLWGYLSRHVFTAGKQFNNKKELIDGIKTEWKKIPISYIQKLYNSIPARIFELISKNGKSTKY